ncbi:hypothetical protein MY5147_009554 [Beauveria neobassiana]
MKDLALACNPAVEHLLITSRRTAVWLRSSSLHADIWDDSVGLRLGIDNRTRWSSWFLVIDRAITKQAEIKAFMTDHEAVLGNNRLNAQDWDFLDKARTFLQPFASATLYAEGEKSSISQSLPLMDALLAHYERNKVYYSQEVHRDLRMVRAVEMGWFVLNKYYNLTDETPVYAAALLLGSFPQSRVYSEELANFMGGTRYCGRERAMGVELQRDAGRIRRYYAIAVASTGNDLPTAWG